MARSTGLGEGAQLRTERRQAPAVVTQPPVVATGAQLIDIELIAPNPRNPKARMIDNLDELAASIAGVGILQPLLLTAAEEWLAAHPEDTTAVAGRAWVAQDGHRRLAAATLAGVAQVPGLPRGADIDDNVMRVTTAYHASKLTPMEEAVNFAALIERGLSQSDISRQTGISQGHISNRLKMLSLPDAVQTAVDQGRVGVQEALQLSRNADTDLIARVGEKIAAAADDEAPPIDLNEVRLAVEADRRHEEAIVNARELADELGGEFVADITDRLTGDVSRHRLTSRIDQVAAGRKNNLLVAPGRHSVTPECYAIQTQRRLPAETPAERSSRARREADEARIEALYRAAERTPPTSLLQQTLITITLRGISLHRTDGAISLAHKLAQRVGLADQTLKAADWGGTLLELPPADQAKAAWIAALAILDSYTSRPATWGPIHHFYAGLLDEMAGYTLTKES